MNDELVGVGSHEGHTTGGDVYEHTVHHGTQVVVGSCEDGLVDTADHHIHVHIELGFLLGQLGQCGIAQTRRAGDFNRAALPANGNLPSVFIGLDGEGLLRELFERVEHQFHGCCDNALALYVVHSYGAHQSGFEVGGGNFELAIFQIEEEEVQNGESVFVANHLTGCSKYRQKCR